MESPKLKKRKTDCHTFENSFVDGIHRSTEEMNFSERSFSNDVDRLPDEVLIEIIAGLPFNDRKNTRLVSKRWYRLNNTRQISSKEKFLCYRVYGLEFVLQTLQNSRKDILNLEFIHFDFGIDRDHLSKFWAENGKRVESLSFTHCKLSEATLEHIIINCDKLRYFAIKNPLAKFRPCKQGRQLMSGPALGKLIKVRRENLRSFEVEACDDTWISDELLEVMFHIYPNIDNFSIICPCFTVYEKVDQDHAPSIDIKDMKDEDAPQLDRTFTFASILKKFIESRTMMRSIYLDAVQFKRSAAYILSLNFPKLIAIENTRLELQAYSLPYKKKVCWEPRIPPPHPIFDFISRHNHLRFIELHISIRGTSEDRSFLEHLMRRSLDSCAQLESLKMKTSKKVLLSDKRIFTKIKNSPLKSLCLNFILEAAHSDEKADTIINKTLRHLHLSEPEDSFGLDRQMVRAFVKTFRGLNEFIIDGASDVNDDVLQDIFLYQRQLTSLKLRYHGLVAEEGGGLSNYGFTGIQSNGEQTGYSIKDLEKLEWLELSHWEPEVSIQFFKKLTLPNLSTLCLDVPIRKELIQSEEFITSFSHLPNLERLVFKGAMHYPSWLKICEQLKKLKFLYIESSFCHLHKWIFPFSKYERFFKKCPSLRVIHRCKVDVSNDNEDLNYKTFSYYLDTVTNEVRMVKKSRERIFPPIMVDSFCESTF